MLLFALICALALPALAAAHQCASNHLDCAQFRLPRPAINSTYNGSD